MSFLTKKEIAARLKININSLSGFIQDDPRAKRFFVKKEILNEVNWRGRIIIKRHKVWGFDQSIIIDFQRFWESKQARKPGRQKIYSPTGSLAWTPTAIECYKRHSYCSPTCSSWEFCNNIYKTTGKKPIKEKVREIFAELGKPIEREEYD